MLHCWRETGKCHHGSPEISVRKNRCEVATASDGTMKLYFCRKSSLLPPVSAASRPARPSPGTQCALISTVIETRAVAELFLNVGRAHPCHQKNRGIGVSQVVGGSDLEPGGQAGPPELALDIPLAETGVSVLGVDQQGVHGAADAEQTLYGSTGQAHTLIWRTARFLCPVMLPRAAGFPRFSPGAANRLYRYPGHRSRRQPGPCPF
jgi:hypothetical protein